MTDAGWYAFKAYNAQAFYGFGFEDEAEHFEAHLNEGRDMNVFGRVRLSDEEGDIGTPSPIRLRGD